MEKVGTYKLEDLTSKIGSGATPKGGKNSYKESGISLIRSLNIYDLEFDKDGLAFIDNEQAEKLSNVEVEKDDVLINITGASVARCCKVPNDILPARVNQHVSILRPKKDQLNADFLQYLLVSPYYKHKLLTYAQGGATREALTKGGLQDFEIDLPPLDTQNRIASILSAFDDLIENNSRRIEILEEMARRIYREWFVHFRYPGHEDDELVDSGTDEFNAVPEGWDMQVMDEILEHYIGGTWGKEEPEDEKNNPAYVIRGTDIPGGRSGNIDDIPLRYHKQSYINSRKLQHGDIVFEVSGGSKNQPVGRAMLITDTFLSELDCDDVGHANFCKLLRSDKSILKPEILYLHIREIYEDGRIMKYQVQSTGISNFKFTFFAENKQMFIPPMELQEKFQEKVSPLFKQMYILGKQINRLKETRDLLLPKLISGKIDVGNLERAGVEKIG